MAAMLPTAERLCLRPYAEIATCASNGQSQPRTPQHQSIERRGGASLQRASLAVATGACVAACQVRRASQKRQRLQQRCVGTAEETPAGEHAESDGQLRIDLTDPLFSVEVLVRMDEPPVLLTVYHGQSPSAITLEFADRYSLPAASMDRLYSLLVQQLQASGLELAMQKEIPQPRADREEQVFSLPFDLRDEIEAFRSWGNEFIENVAALTHNAEQRIAEQRLRTMLAAEIENVAVTMPPPLFAEQSVSSEDCEKEHPPAVASEAGSEDVVAQPFVDEPRVIPLDISCLDSLYQVLPGEVTFVTGESTQDALDFVLTHAMCLAGWDSDSDWSFRLLFNTGDPASHYLALQRFVPNLSWIFEHFSVDVPDTKSKTLDMDSTWCNPTIEWVPIFAPGGIGLDPSCLSFLHAAPPRSLRGLVLFHSADGEIPDLDMQAVRRRAAETGTHVWIVQPGRCDESFCDNSLHICASERDNITVQFGKRRGGDHDDVVLRLPCRAG